MYSKLIKIIVPFLLTLNAYGADYFWVGGTGNWSEFSTHWATTSNGTTFHTNTPTLADDVFFDSNSGTSFNDTIFIDINGTCNNIKIDGFNKIKQLANFNVFGTFDLVQGDFYSNGFNLSLNKFYSDYNFFRTFDLTNSVLNLTGADTVWTLEPTSFTFGQTGSMINLTYTGDDMVTFSAGGNLITYETVNCILKNLQFIENSTFNNLTLVSGIHLYLPALTINGLPLTLKGNTINCVGNCTSSIIIEGIPINTAATQAILDANAGAFNADFTRFKNINGTNGMFNATNSIDLGNNTGITITEDPSTAIVTWINGTGNWSDAAHWSTGCIPGPNNSVLFNATSFSAAGQTVNVDVDAFCENMTWTSVNNPILIGNSNSLFLRGNMELDANMTTTFSEEFVFSSITALTKTIQTNGVIINAHLRFNSQLGTYDFLDDLTSNNCINFELGTLTSIGRNMTLDGFVAGESLNRNLDITNSNYTLTGVDSTWVMNANNLTLTTAGSEIVVNHTLPTQSIIKGGSQVYNIFRLLNIGSSLYDSNTFSILEVSPHSSLAMESGVTQNIDSLIANGSCAQMITIESTDNFGAAAHINKTGYDTLIVSSVNLMNVTANATAPKYNLAQNSTISYSTTGWDTTDIGIGASYYWVNGSGEWKDISHWESPLGNPAICLPTLRDTVYFNSTSFLLNGDSVLVNSDAYFSHMDWAGSEIWNPKLHLIKNLYCRDNILFNPSMQVDNSNSDAEIKFIPENNNCLFTTFDTPINSNVTLSGLVLTDTLKLNGDLKIDSLKSLFIAAGTFDSNSDSIFAGTFATLGNEPNLVELYNSEVELSYSLDFSTLTTLNSGTSHIHLNSAENGAYFNGASLIYHDVTIESITSDTVTHVLGSNSFNNLTLIKKLKLRLEDGQTQTILGNITAIGNCLDSIFIMSQTNGISSTLNLTVAGNVECISSSDINVSTSNLNALFSSNNTNNTGLWNFDTTPHSTPLFTTNYEQCLGNLTTFTNTSTSYQGGFTGLTFDWDLGNSNTSTLTNPTITYSTAEKFYISLTTTYTNFCTDTYLDSVNINHPIAQLTSTDIDTSICDTESVIFNAVSSPQADTYDFIVNGTSNQIGTSQTYSLNNLNNGEVVTLDVTLNGCTTTSANILTFVVHDLPNVTLTATNETICDGNNVIFTANGADIYKFYIDGIAQTAFSTTNTFSSSTLINNQVVSVEGRDTLTGCDKSGDIMITMTVNPNPIPLFSNSDADNVICNGDPVTFTGSVATEFEFLINGNSVQGPSTTTTLNSNTLVSGDVITMIGYDLGCGTQSLDTYTFIVNPIPTVSLSNPTGTTICENDNVSFTADGATSYQYFVGGLPVQGPSGLPTYSTSAIANGETVYVVGSSNNCFSNSAIQAFIVNPLPIPTFTSSDLDNIICQNESVTFNTSGATQFQFLLDGFPVDSYSAITNYTTDSLNNGQTVTLMGKQLGCYALSTDIFNFTVKPKFNVNLFSSDTDLTICDGESIGFTGVAGSGITSYDLYVNGTLESSSTNNTFNITTLAVGTQFVSLSATKDGCTYFAEDTISVLIKPIPVVTLSSSDLDNVICDGDSVLFIANGALDYEFLIDGISQGIVTQDSLYLNTLTNGQTVSVNGILNGCSAGSPTYNFVVNDVPNVLLVSDDINNILCEGDAITFTASGATNYEFFIDGISQGASSPTFNLSTSTLTSNSTFDVTGEANGCSSDALSLNVIVNNLPVISTTISDVDATICEGDIVTVNTDGASTYQLLINNIPTSSPNIQNSFTINTIMDGDIITTQGSSSSGCFSTSQNAFTFTVNPNPIVTLTSSDVDSTICIGDIVSFNTSGATTYDYYVDDVLATTGTTYITDSIQNGQIISIEGHLNGCTSTSNLMPFTVYLYPVSFMTTADLDSTICLGDTIIFQGLGAFDYEFFLNGYSIQGPAQNDSLYITTLTDGDIITVSGINNGCHTLSNPIPVSVISYPTTTLLSSDGDNEICFGELVTFISNGATNYEFFINDISQGISSTTSVLSTTTLNNNDSIWVIGYNGECMLNAPQSFKLTVNVLPLTLTSADNNLICSGEPVTYNSSGAELYEFFIDGNSVQSESTNPTFTSTNLQDGQTLTVYGYSSVTGCTQLAQTSHLLTVMDNPIITSSTATTLCQGDSTVLASSTPNWNQWYLNSSQILNATDQDFIVYESGDYYTEITLGGNGNVLAVGNNAHGQFGDNSTINALVATNTDNLQNSIELKSGANHNLALDNSGTVYTWGENNSGQLGNGNYSTLITPYTTNITNVISVSAGHDFSLAVLSTGEIMSWGKNDLGQLGLGNNGTTNFPFLITGIANVAKVAAGQNHGVALLNDGTVMAWGDNQFGQLGIGSFTNENTPQSIVTLNGIESINCGANHTMAIDSSGTLYIWGHNSDGQLGINDIQFSNVPLVHPLDNIQSIDGGYAHTLALTADNQLYSWGNNEYGQLGTGTNVSSVSPIHISSLDAVSTIATNFNANYIIKNDNSIWSWGQNFSSQLGNENNSDQSVPVHISNLTGVTGIGIGEAHSVFLTGFSNSCPSNTISVVVNPSPEVTITLTNGTLTASPSGGSYQWYINGIIIPSAMDIDFNPQTPGYYTCEVTYDGGCSSLSNEYSYLIVGTNENEPIDFIIYPNPNHGTFVIEGNFETYQNLEIEIYNALSQHIKDLKTQTNQPLNVTLDTESGVYFVVIKSANKATKIERLIIN